MISFVSGKPLHVYGPKGTNSMMKDTRKAFQAEITIRHSGEGLLLTGVAIRVKDINEGIVYDSGRIKI